MADIGSILGSAGLGGAIGQAVVRLELDSKKYLGEMKAAEAQTVGSANAMGASTSKMAAVSQAALLGAGVAVAAFAAFSVKAAIEANEAHIKLQNTFENNAKLSDSSVEAFERQADALRDLTGVDDEAVITAQALLGAFDLTGAQVQELIPLIVDLSAKYGIDLETAAKAVGKAVNGNTGSLARYGIVLDKAAVEADAFGAVLQGLGKNAGFAEARAKAEPWRVLGAQFEEVAESVGFVLLPIIQELTKALEPLVAGLKIVADNLDVVVVTLVGFAAFKYLPGLLFNIALGLEAVGAASLANGILSVAAAMSGLAATFAAAAGPAVAFAAALTAGTAALVKFDPLHILPSVEDFQTEMEDGTIKVGKFNDAVIYGKTVLSLQGDELDVVADHTANLTTEAARAELHQRQLAESVDEVTASLHEQIDAILAIADPTFALISAVRDNATAEKELAQAHDHVNKLQREGKRDTDAYAEAQRDLKEKALAAAESQAGLLGAVRKLQEEIASGKTTRHEAIEAIRDLGKEAGLTGEDIRGLVDDIKGGLADAADTARRLAPEIGRAMMLGIKTGITTNSEIISVAAAQAVHDAIQAARDAAKIHSPSEVMRDLGLDMMEGLYIGITKGAQKAIDGARKEIEKLVDQIGSELDKVKGKAQSFADSIRSGFSGFLDISGAFGSAGEGADLSSVLAAQVGGATALANVLEALKRQGASKATLSQVAGAGVEFGQTLLQGGPDLITEMNNSLRTISELANQTGKGLSESFFGEKIDRLEKRLERQNELLRDLVEIERLGHDHAIILDGVKVTETIRSQLVKTGNRNPDIFGGRA